MFDSAPDPCLESPPLALQQSSAWLKGIQLLGSNASMEEIGRARAMVLRESVPIAGSMALISRADLHLTPAIAAGLRDQLSTRHLVINAETETDAQALNDSGFHRIASARHVAELTLSPSTTTMAAGLHQKWRNRLRKGQSNGLVLRRRPMPAEPRHWLFRAEVQQARRLWYQPVPPQVIVALAEQTPGAAQLFTAYHHGFRVAAMLFLRHGTGATYQIGWSNAEGRALSAGPALMWKAMVDLQAMGVDSIDLGAADPERSPDLTRFKRGTGAVVRPLGGTWLDTAWARRKRRTRSRTWLGSALTNHGAQKACTGGGHGADL